MPTSWHACWIYTYNHWSTAAAAVSEALLVKGYELVSVGIVITHADGIGRWYNDSLLMSPCSSALQLQVFKKLRSSIL